MEYTYKGLGLSVTPEIREYVEKRFQSLNKLLPDATLARADIAVEYRSTEEKQYRGEVMLHHPSLERSLRAEASGNTLHEALDTLHAELFRELTHEKKKHQRLLRRGAGQVKEFLRGWRNRS